MAYRPLFPTPQQNNLLPGMENFAQPNYAPQQGLNTGFTPVSSGLSQAMGVSPLGNSLNAAVAPTPPTGPDWLSMEGAFGKNGWAGTALGAASGLMQGFMGMQNYGLAKDQLNFQKDAFEKNLANQTKLTNNSLEDRQRARVASNAGAYQSVDDYMRQNRV